MQLFGLVLAVFPQPGQRQDMRMVYAEVTDKAESAASPRLPQLASGQAVGGKKALHPARGHTDRCHSHFNCPPPITSHPEPEEMGICSMLHSPHHFYCHSNISRCVKNVMILLTGTTNTKLLNL